MYVCVCMCARVSVRMHASLYTIVYMRVYKYLCARARVYVYVCTIYQAVLFNEQFDCFVNTNVP